MLFVSLSLVNYTRRREGERDWAEMMVVVVVVLDVLLVTSLCKLAGLVVAHRPNWRL